MGDATDIPITEHARQSLTPVDFGLFDLPGLQLSPWIRELGKITLYRSGSKKPGHATASLLVGNLSAAVVTWTPDAGPAIALATGSFAWHGV